LSGASLASALPALPRVQDAEHIRRLHAAGCVIIAKVNLSEFASGGALSTLGGQIPPPGPRTLTQRFQRRAQAQALPTHSTLWPDRPTRSRPPRLIKDDSVPLPPNLYAGTAILANVTGWPDLIVPASVTSDPALPVGWSFIGPAFSKSRLLALGYAFEQANPARTLPVTTPMLLASALSSDRRYASPPCHFFGISFS